MYTRIFLFIFYEDMLLYFSYTYLLVCIYLLICKVLMKEHAIYLLDLSFTDRVHYKNESPLY